MNQKINRPPLTPCNGAACVLQKTQQLCAAEYTLMSGFTACINGGSTTGAASGTTTPLTTTAAVTQAVTTHSISAATRAEIGCIYPVIFLVSAVIMFF